MAETNNQTPNFEFIMKQEPKPKRPLRLPTNLPRPVVLGGLAVFALLIIVMIASLFKGGGNTTGIYQLMSDANTVAIVSQDTTLSTTNTDSQNIANTVRQSMLSQQQQFKKYLISQKIKPNLKLIASKPDASSAAALSNSKLNNTYDSVYKNYLKTSLSAYQVDLKKTYQTAGPNLKVIINSAYASNSTLLTSKQLQ